MSSSERALAHATAAATGSTVADLVRLAIAHEACQLGVSVPAA